MRQVLQTNAIITSKIVQSNQNTTENFFLRIPERPNFRYNYKKEEITSLP